MKVSVASTTPLLISGLCGITVGCSFLFDTVSDSAKTVRLVDDSPAIEAAIKQAEEVDRHSRFGQEFPARREFLNAMAASPSFEVPPRTHFHELELSEAICSHRLYQNPTYVKLMIKTGPYKGRIGWGCMGDGISRAHSMP
jgi:hypothetical protein